MSALEQIADGRQLAAVLGVKYSTLVYFCNDGRRYGYQKFEIPKRNGGTRVISAPSEYLKALQRKLLTVLEEDYSAPLPVHGFVRGRGIVSNANNHVGRPWVVNIDLDAYFPSISVWRIRGALIALPYKANPAVATLIARLGCQGDFLPQGAPTSPILANIVTKSLDTKLRALARRLHVSYSRYADDITFSGRTRIVPSALAQHTETGGFTCSPEVRKIVMDAGFVLNDSKFRVQRRTDKQVVTGLVVNSRTNVDRRVIRQIRAMLHAWRKFGYDKAQSEYQAKYWRISSPGQTPPNYQSVVGGKLSFVMSVRGERDEIVFRLLQEFSELCTSPGTKARVAGLVRERLNINQRLERAVCVIESDMYQGTGFLVENLGIVTCAHCVDDKNVVAFLASAPDVRIPVTVLQKDDNADFAVLQADGILALEPLKATTRATSIGDSVYVAGFPNYSKQMTVSVRPAVITHKRLVFGMERIGLSTGVIAGMSGGPVVTATGEVVGIAVTGERREAAQDRGSEENGAIPWTTVEWLSPIAG